MSSKDQVALKIEEVSQQDENLHALSSLKIKVTSCLRKNKITKYKKPNEDYLIADETNLLFVLMDGATRFLHQSANAPDNYPDPSPSAQAARMICNVTYNILKSQTLDESNYQEMFYHASKEANQELQKYNNHLFPNVDYLENDLACAGGVIAAIRKNKLLFSFIADPQIFLIRDYQLSLLNEPQTLAANDFVRELNRRGITDPAIVQKTICKAVRNKVSSAYRFGVFSGEAEALSFLQHASIEVEAGDKILLTSDGLAPLWIYDRDVLLSEELEFIFDAAERIDGIKQLKSDDKSAILIEII
jgi:serine/threonine protein phosphatase PrpC